MSVNQDAILDEIIKMTNAYPLLSCWRNGQYWSGFVTVQGKLLRFCLTVPNFPDVKSMKVEVDQETKLICSSIKADVFKKLKQGTSLSAFMTTFVDLLTNVPCDKAEENDSNLLNSRSPEFYNILLDELEQIGVENISYISPNYNEIHVSHTDIAGRKHSMKFHLSHRYPYDSLGVNADLPVDNYENFKWPSKIIKAAEFFRDQMAKYNNFWTEMDTLDEHTRVIDPRNAHRGHTYRRILIQEKVVMHIKINPVNPKVFPDLHLTGPEKVIDNLNHLLARDFEKWNEHRPLLTNLEDILQLQFLPKISHEENDNEIDVDLKCTICYMYDLNGEVPERTCVCSASFHNRCLYDLYVNDFAGCGKKFVECPLCSVEMNILVTFNN